MYMPAGVLTSGSMTGADDCDGWPDAVDVGPAFPDWELAIPAELNEDVTKPLEAIGIELS
jgi:hypothetical protein